jgi:hypothetical protein
LITRMIFDDTYINTCTQTYMHTHIHTHTHTYIHTRFFSSLKRSDRLWDRPCPIFNVYLGSFVGYSGRCLNLATHLHLAPKLIMSGATLLLPPYAFMTWQAQLYILAPHGVNETRLEGESKIYESWPCLNDHTRGFLVPSVNSVRN